MRGQNFVLSILYLPLNYQMNCTGPEKREKLQFLILKKFPVWKIPEENNNYIFANLIKQWIVFRLRSEKNEF